MWELGAWSPEGLRRARRPAPEPGPGEVVVAVEAASLNYRDLVMLGGGYGRVGGTLPLVPVSDGAGRVVAVGEGVEESLLGRLVMPTFFQGWRAGAFPRDAVRSALGGPLDGVMQPRMRLPREGVVPAPAGWSAAEAATLPCAALTAWNAVVGHARTRPGEVVVVEGTGGVACFAIQFARLAGAEVVAVTSGPAKAERARALGAGTVVDRAPGWGKAVAAGGGADLVVDLGGGETLAEALRAVRPGGTVSLIGVLGGGDASFPLGPVVTRAVTLRAVTCGSRADLEAMVRALEAGGARPEIDRTFAFGELPGALAHLRAGGHVGKVCVEVGGG